MTERKDFEDWQVHVAYMRQEGMCANCGCTLQYGMGTGKRKKTDFGDGKPFERHHADGDSLNIETENLELLCKSCHRASLAVSDEDYAKRYQKFKKVREDIIGKLLDLVDLALGKEVPSTSISKTQEVLAQALQLRKDADGMNEGIFYPPPSIKALIAQRNIQVESKAMIDGFKLGVSAIRIELGNLKYDSKRVEELIRKANQLMKNEE